MATMYKFGTPILIQFVVLSCRFTKFIAFHLIRFLEYISLGGWFTFFLFFLVLNLDVWRELTIFSVLFFQVSFNYFWNLFSTMILR